MSRLNIFNKDVKQIKGVGEKRAKKLSKLNINNAYQLLTYFPKTYEDRRYFKTISNCQDGQKVTLKVQVCGHIKNIKTKKGYRITKVPVKDDTGYAFLVWFNQPYICNNFNKNCNLKINGKVKIIRNQIQIYNVVFEREEKNNKIGKIIPIYSLTQNFSNNEIMTIVKNAIQSYGDKIKETLPINILSKYKFISKGDAIKNIHFPKNKKIFNQAKRRLIFEEFFIFQLGLLYFKNVKNNNKSGIQFKKIDDIKKFINQLPYKLTSAQNRVCNEIINDMESSSPMNRLIQGDVGSGKTIVAIIAMLKSAKSGYQSVMMAPTEILARQHYNKIKQFLEGYDIKCGLLVGSLSNKEKKILLNKITEGNINVLIGTHALIQDTVSFKKLGLVITDEQHRFGVKQRRKLISKGVNPDILVMTATPIPRTLALVIYNNLDISIIDELPPGRKKVETYVVNRNYKKRVYNFVKKQIDLGRQAYIVCPLIEESNSSSIQSASTLYKMLSDSFFQNNNISLLHGRLSAKEKDKIMEKFNKGEISVLVSTTVIEVGINIPNANIIVIENAERFGLAQLHQLRGRVGRGKHKSYCILINESNNTKTYERMKVMEKTNDGFKVSEKDLKIRGQGDILGVRQHGLPQFKIGDIFKHYDIFRYAQKEALDIYSNDPQLKKVKNNNTKIEIHNIFNINYR